MHIYIITCVDIRMIFRSSPLSSARQESPSFSAFSLAIPQLLNPKVAGAIATALPFKSLNGAAQDRLCGPGDFRQVWYI